MTLGIARSPVVTGRIKVVEPANGRARVIMVCREAWSATGVVEPKGFRWTGRSARLDSHLWDAG